MKVLTYIAAFLLCAAGAAQSVPTTDEVVILQPQTNSRVGCQADVAGTATLVPGGRHLWAFVVRDDMEDIWFPQAEAKIDPVTKKYSVRVQFGERRDVGMPFRIALAVVQQSEHIALQNYRLHAMKSGDWRPIEMPPTVSPPQVRTVMKIAHDCE